VKGELPTDGNSAVYVALNTTYKSGTGKMCKISQQYLTYVRQHISWLLEAWMLSGTIWDCIATSLKNLAPATKFFTPAVPGQW